MPHAVIEYSANIEEEVLCADITDLVYGAMANSKLFQDKDIKVRSYPCGDFIVGEKGQDGTFVHVTVSLLEGRTTEQKQALSQSVLESIAPSLAQVDQVTVEVRELIKASYRKAGA